MVYIRNFRTKTYKNIDITENNWTTVHILPLPRRRKSTQLFRVQGSGRFRQIAMTAKRRKLSCNYTVYRCVTWTTIGHLSTIRVIYLQIFGNFCLKNIEITAVESYTHDTLIE